MIYAATIVTTNFRYLLQGNVQIVKWHNPKAGNKTQQTHCRQWSIPGAWLHGSITSWWSRYSFHKVQGWITPIRDNSVDFNHWIQLSTGTQSGAPTYAWNSWDYVTLIAHHWRDKAYLKKNTTCNHKYLCPCKKVLLADRQFDRPFVQLPIGDPQMMNHQTNHDYRNHNFIKPSARDEEKFESDY